MRRGGARRRSTSSSPRELPERLEPLAEQVERRLALLPVRQDLARRVGLLQPGEERLEVSCGERPRPPRGRLVDADQRIRARHEVVDEDTLPPVEPLADRLSNRAE